MTKHEIERLLREKVSLLHKNFNINRIGLFGSFVRNEQQEDSDIDLLVEFDKAIGLFKFAKLQMHLAGLLKRQIDLTTPSALKPLIKDNILNEVEWIERY